MSSSRNFAEFLDSVPRFSEFRDELDEPLRRRVAARGKLGGVDMADLSNHEDPSAVGAVEETPPPVVLPGAGSPSLESEKDDKVKLASLELELKYFKAKFAAMERKDDNGMEAGRLAAQGCSLVRPPSRAEGSLLGNRGASPESPSLWNGPEVMAPAEVSPEKPGAADIAVIPSGSIDTQKPPAVVYGAVAECTGAATPDKGYYGNAIYSTDKVVLQPGASAPLHGFSKGEVFTHQSAADKW